MLRFCNAVECLEVVAEPGDGTRYELLVCQDHSGVWCYWKHTRSMWRRYAQDTGLLHIVSSGSERHHERIRGTRRRGLGGDGVAYDAEVLTKIVNAALDLARPR